MADHRFFRIDRARYSTSQKIQSHQEMHRAGSIVTLELSRKEIRCRLTVPENYALLS